MEMLLCTISIFYHGPSGTNQDLLQTDDIATSTNCGMGGGSAVCEG